MAKQITIVVENEEDMVYAIQEVANLVDEGYCGGLIGYSADSFCVEDVE